MGVAVAEEMGVAVGEGTGVAVGEGMGVAVGVWTEPGGIGVSRAQAERTMSNRVSKEQVTRFDMRDLLPTWPIALFY